MRVSDIFEQSFSDVLKVSASNAPTPGGGSVSGMVACFGAAMAAMVGNLTVGKEKFKDVEPAVREILTGTEKVMAELKTLVASDMAGFDNFMQAFRMPKGTDEEKQEREDALQAASKKATDTPLAIARACLAGLELAARLAPLGNKMAISDDGVAAYVLEACVPAVLLSAEINLPGIKDSAYVEKVVAEKEQLKAKARALRDNTLKVVAERMA
ncbi:MAG: cyclodeaminase/cyclohydrolase family protein [Peptococcaceae bacterium]|nr:cyclodeaminase/cyclohydrolase family protein [Peptococcaceae bacterium]